MTFTARSRRVIAVPALCLAACVATSGLRGDPGHSSSNSAPRNVAIRLLQAEAEGDLLARQLRLREVEGLEDACELTRAVQGMILDGGRWMTIDDSIAGRDAAPHLEAYRKLRSSVLAPLGTLSANQHVALGYWCQQNQLPAQATAHWRAAVTLEPDHAVAHRALGSVLIGQQWISRSRFQAMQAQNQRAQESLRRFAKPLEQILQGLTAEREKVRVTARDNLQTLRDPNALAAAALVFDRADPAVYLAFTDWVSSFDTVESSRLLARIALMHPVETVRDQARDALRTRPLHDFVPQLIEMLSSPIAANLLPVFRPDGSLAGYRQAFVRETAQERNLVVVDTNYARNVINVMLDERDTGTVVASPDGQLQNLNASVERAVLASANRDAQMRQSAVQATNQRLVNMNINMADFLSDISGDEIAGNANAIWQWWADLNEVEVSKGQRFSRSSIGFEVPHYQGYASFQAPTGGGRQELSPEDIQAQRRAISLGSFDSVQPVRSSDCFVAGTPVVTDRGLRAIETIQPGDSVLSRNVESGALEWSPVIAATSRPPEPIVAVHTADGCIKSTGGHVYWVSGQGWKKARHLAAGDVLHGACQPSIVCRTEQVPAEMTHNLIVPGNANFFVGAEMVLTHDVTIRKPTRLLVPGLLPTELAMHVETP